MVDNHPHMAPDAVCDIPTVSPKHRYSSEEAKRAVQIREQKRAQRKTARAILAKDPQALDSQYKLSKDDWAAIEESFRESIREAQSSGDKKSVVAIVTAAAIAHDKAYKNQTEVSPSLITPTAIADRMHTLMQKLAQLPSESKGLTSPEIMDSAQTSTISTPEPSNVG